MLSLFSFIAGAGVFTSISMGLLYYFDRERAENITTTITWNAVKTYHKLNLKYNNFKRYYLNNTIEKESRSDDEENDESDESDILQFLGYNISDGLHITEYVTNKFENNSYINDTNFDLMFLRKKVDDDSLYRRIFSKDEINLNVNIFKIDKPFIQIELCYDNEKTENISIHKNLKYFYVNDSFILDEKFIRWYMKTFYDVLVMENYKLSIIDSNVNMLSIDNSKIVHLNSKNEKVNYDVKTV